MPAILLPLSLCSKREPRLEGRLRGDSSALQTAKRDITQSHNAVHVKHPFHS